LNIIYICVGRKHDITRTNNYLAELTMKYFFAVITFVTLNFTGFAQKEVNEKLYSKSTNDTVNYTVWLPKDWSANQKYTTIYTFNYGASNAEYIADQITYLKKLNITQVPPIIVVNIWVNMDRIGYNYETGLLTSKGFSLIKCIKNEIIPAIERKYKASKFRAYIGQSYAASYGNYLFLYQPDIFSAYILMAPEKLSLQEPPFEITQKLVISILEDLHSILLLRANMICNEDKIMQKKLKKKVKQLDSIEFNFKHERLSANHNNIIAHGLPLALEFIYKSYSSYPELDSATTVISAIKNFEKKINDIYGIQPEKSSFNLYNYFLSQIWQRNDTIGMLDALNYFITDKSNGRNLRDFAYSCSIVGLKENAEQLYEQAIKKILKDEISTDLGPVSLITCYRELAFNILKNEPQQGWNLLQKALQVCIKYKDNIHIDDYYPDIYFYLGQFSANNDYNVQKGLEYLLLYAGKRKDLVDIIHFRFDRVYYTIGKCYTLLHDTTNAKLFLQKALELNTKNKEAKELLQKL